MDREESTHLNSSRGGVHGNAPMMDANGNEETGAVTRSKAVRQKKSGKRTRRSPRCAELTSKPTDFQNNKSVAEDSGDKSVKNDGMRSRARSTNAIAEATKIVVSDRPSKAKNGNRV